MVSRNNADIDGPRASCLRRGAQVAGWFVLEGGTDFSNVGGRSIFRCSWQLASCGGASACQVRVIMGKRGRREEPPQATGRGKIGNDRPISEWSPSDGSTGGRGG
jgi:hypothetical protein